MAQIKQLNGFPTSWGNKRACVVGHAGPSSYLQVSLGSPSGSPVSGGDTFEAVSAGMKMLDYVTAGVTDDGLYRVVCIPLGATDDPGAAPQPTYCLMWFVVATGNEAADSANLSGSIVRVLAIGPV